MLQKVLENIVFTTGKLRERLEEYFGGLAITLAMLLYALGLLSLTMLGSSLFILFCYLGTIFLVSGVLAKVGVLRRETRLTDKVVAILIFTSSLLLTTSVVTLFIDVKVSYTISHTIPITAGPSPTYGSDYHDLTGPEALPGLGGLEILFVRPFAWLFLPLLIIGAIIFVIAAAIIYFTV